jgi:hypothetical protein
VSRSSLIAASFLAASIGSKAVLPEAADAASLGNRDEKDRKVTIVEPSGSKEHVLKPGAVLQGICAKGCVVRLGEGTDREYQLEGNEIVSVEKGYLYFEGPETPAAADAVEPKPGGKPPAGKSGTPRT